MTPLFSVCSIPIIGEGQSELLHNIMLYTAVQPPGQLDRCLQYLCLSVCVCGGGGIN